MRLAASGPGDRVGRLHETPAAASGPGAPADRWRRGETQVARHVPTPPTAWNVPVSPVRSGVNGYSRYSKAKTALDVRQVDRVQQMVQPAAGQLLLDRVLPQPHVQVREIDAIHLLILVEAREDEFLAPGRGIDVLLQALRADLFHHALHR